MLNNLYSILFLLARFVNILILCSLSFVILNARYLFSEQFFPNIKKIFFLNVENLEIFLYRFNILKQFITYVNNIQYIVFFILISGILLLLLYRIYINNRTKLFIYASLYSFLFYVAVSLFFFNFQLNFQYLFAVPLIYFVAIFFNFKLFSTNKTIKLILLIPVFAEIFFVNHIINHIKSKTNFFIRYFLVFLNINILIVICLPIVVNFQKIYENNENIILKGDFYSINIDDINNKIVFNEKNKRQFFILDEINKNFKSYNIAQKTTLESMAFNNNKNEYYIYDEGTGFLSVLNGDNFSLQNSFFVSNDFGDFKSHERVLFDNKNDNILILLEKGQIYIFNAFNKVAELPVFDRSDSIIYNSLRNSYLITYWYNKPYITEIFVDNYKLQNIPAYDMQGYAAFSKQNKEIYIAFHQQGRIGVYDAETMKLKRKIKGQYAVKGIIYDEDLNILIAPSYFTGYIDIFLMDGTDKLLITEFIGHEIREAKFNKNKENIYAVSRFGIYKKAINIKDLINKNKVSHETINK